MFGQNPVEKADITGDGLSLRVVQGSPFYTIQGEGPFSGQPAVFLRLHGCPLRCHFCDTEFSKPEDPTWDVSYLLDRIMEVRGPSRLVVITGGEPVRQNLGPMVELLVRQGMAIQVETSGILWQNCLLQTVVVVSPKTPRIHPMVAHHAAVWKYVIQCGELAPEDGLPLTNTQIPSGRKEYLARPWDYFTKDNPFRGQVYVSPCDEYDEVRNKLNHAEVARVAMEFGYRAGLQVHKYLNLP